MTCLYPLCFHPFQENSYWFRLLHPWEDCNKGLQLWDPSVCRDFSWDVAGSAGSVGHSSIPWGLLRPRKLFWGAMLILGNLILLQLLLSTSFCHPLEEGQGAGLCVRQEIPPFPDHNNPHRWLTWSHFGWKQLKFPSSTKAMVQQQRSLKREVRGMWEQEKK